MSFFTNRKDLPMDDADSLFWFHGSPRQLTTLGAGSAMTRNKRLAEAFSHKPTIMCFANDGTIKHNGTMDGYLYQIDEPISERDAEVHPGIVRGDAWEWTRKRDLKLKLLERTTVILSQRIGKIKAALICTGTHLVLLLRSCLRRLSFRTFSD
jgi:hypothetical protein